MMEAALCMGEGSVCTEEGSVCMGDGSVCMGEDSETDIFEASQVSITAIRRSGTHSYRGP